MANSVNKIGIEVEAKISGGQDIRRQVDDINSLRDASTQLKDLHAKAGDMYADDLSKQNRYISDQLKLKSQIESVDHREYAARIRRERETSRVVNKQRIDDASNTREKESAKKNAQIQDDALRAKLHQENQDYISTQSAIRRDTVYQKDWAREQGLGGYGDGAPRPGVERDMMTALSSGDIRGVAGAGVRAGMSKIAGRFAGASTLAKLGMGTGVGLLGLGAYKLISGLSEGWGSYKDLAPGMLEMQAMSGNLSQSPEALRNNILLGSTAGLQAKEFMPLMQQWQRTGGISNMGDPETESLIRTIRTGQAYGIDSQAAMGITGTLARTGTDIGTMNEDKLARVIREGLVAGVDESRLPEYLNQVSQVTNAVMQTAITFDPNSLLSQISDIASLGLQFQGERGAGVMTSLHGALTQEGGLGFEAARRVAETRMGAGGYSLADVKRIQEGGITEPDLIQELLSMSGQMAGGDRERQALILSQNTSLGMRQWEPLLEMFNERGVARGKNGVADDPDLIKRIESLTTDPLYQRAQENALTASAKIYASSELFEGASNTFNSAVVKLAALIGGERVAQFLPDDMPVNAVNIRTGVQPGQRATVPKSGVAVPTSNPYSVGP